MVTGRKAAISERVASAVRRAQEEIEVSEPMEESVMEQPELPFVEEREQESSYENRENEDGPTISYRPNNQETPIDRMQWISTQISETPNRL